ISDGAGNFVASTQVDSTGNYSTPGLPAGNYYAKTTNSAGFADKLYNDIVCSGCNVTTGNAIVVTAGGTNLNIDFALTQGARFSGRVTDLATGAALTGVNVDINNTAGFFFASVQTDATGNYTTAGLPAATYYAKTSRSGNHIDKLYNDI